MAFQLPFTSWSAGTGILATDLNRMEGNTESIVSTLGKYIKGFNFDNLLLLQNPTGQFIINAGECVDDTGVWPIELKSALIKTEDVWAAGDGNGGRAPGVTSFNAYTWYYVFVILNPTSGAVDIIFDDNVSGSNVSITGYTYKRRIGCIKSASSGNGFYRTKSLGNEFFIEPTSSSEYYQAPSYSTSYVVWDMNDSTYGDPTPAGIEHLAVGRWLHVNTFSTPAYYAYVKPYAFGSGAIDNGISLLGISTIGVASGGQKNTILIDIANRVYVRGEALGFVFFIPSGWIEDRRV